MNDMDWDTIRAELQTAGDKVTDLLLELHAGEVSSIPTWLKRADEAAVTAKAILARVIEKLGD